MHGRVDDLAAFASKIYRKESPCDSFHFLRLGLLDRDTGSGHDASIPEVSQVEILAPYTGPSTGVIASL